MRIAVEGIDGSGKSTLINNVISHSDLSLQVISKKTNRPLRDIYKQLLQREPFISTNLSFFLGMADYLYAMEYLEDPAKKHYIYDRSFISGLVDCQSLGLNLEPDIPRIARLFPKYDWVVYIDATASSCFLHKNGVISQAEAGGSQEALEENFKEFQTKNTVNYKKFIGCLHENGLIGNVLIIPGNVSEKEAMNLMMSVFQEYL